VTSDVSQLEGEHPFASFVRILGKGKSGSRSLNQSEARQAFKMILCGQVEDVQLGAFLMLLRVKEESAAEIAGFVEACRDEMLRPPGDLQVDLDWSSYAGKRSQHPWYILSMLLLSEVGIQILAHGSAGHTPGRLYTEDAMRALGLPVASDWQEVETQLGDTNLSYISLKSFCEPLEAIMQLRPLLGLRSPVNTLARLLNPAKANCSIQSIFHPAYGRIHQQADQLLKQPYALVFKGESGEVEIKPHADTQLLYLSDNQTSSDTLGRVINERVERVAQPGIEPLRALWDGSQSEEYGLAATLGTAALALQQVEQHKDLTSARARAEELWQKRDKSRLH
jgi:anthranilate phosphoribosyltransferase